MANIKIPRKEFEKHIKLTPEVIEKISLFGTPLESINEKEIEIEIFPNRPDLLSTQGYTRAFMAFIGKSPGLKEYKSNPPQKDFTVTIDPETQDIRPYTACAIVKNLSLDDEKIKEIIDIQEKLHNTIGRNRKKAAIGIYPLEKIKLPITYTAKKPTEIKFTPLETQREMNAYQILQRHPAGRTYADLLKGLSKYPIFVDSNNKILSMPPIINSHDTGKITSQTKEVFVECSGSNLQTLKKVLTIVTTTLAEMGGKIYQMNLCYPKNKRLKTPDFAPEKIKISLENTNKLLGLNLKEQDLSKYLQRMGYNYKNKMVEIPAWRTDILHEVDIIEDIAIAYGYENLKPEIPHVATIGQESNPSKLNSKIAEILSGLKLLEISTYHLIKPEDSRLSKQKSSIELETSKTEYKWLRQDLLTPMLRILSENVDAEYPQNIFEIGTVFKKDLESETGIRETNHLTIGLTPGNFTQAKQTLDYLIRSLNLQYSLKESTHPCLIEGRTGAISINKKEIGYIGELHPNTLKAWHLKMPLSVIEISLEEIYSLLK